MGQKVNPTGFRVGVNKKWKSVWYSSDDLYGDTVVKDHGIRKLLNKEFANAGVETIQIKRYLNKTEVLVKVSRPGVAIGRGGENVEEAKEKLKDLTENEVLLKIKEVDNPSTSAKLIANRIVAQLERRMVPKYIMNKELEKATNTGKIKGIRIWVAGRIKGVEIARTEKVEWGKLPLQTLKADIEYAFEEAQVPNAGKQGVKVWVYREKEEEEK